MHGLLIYLRRITSLDLQSDHTRFQPLCEHFNPSLAVRPKHRCKSNEVNFRMLLWHVLEVEAMPWECFILSQWIQASSFWGLRLEVTVCHHVGESRQRD